MGMIRAAAMGRGAEDTQLLAARLLNDLDDAPDRMAVLRIAHAQQHTVRKTGRRALGAARHIHQDHGRLTMGLVPFHRLATKSPSALRLTISASTTPGRAPGT